MLGDYCMKKRRGLSALLTIWATVGSMSMTSPAMAVAYVITVGGTTPTYTKAEAYGDIHKLLCEPGFITYDWSASENNIINLEKDGILNIQGYDGLTNITTSYSKWG